VSAGEGRAPEDDVGVTRHAAGCHAVGRPRQALSHACHAVRVLRPAARAGAAVLRQRCGAAAVRIRVPEATRRDGGAAAAQAAKEDRFWRAQHEHAPCDVGPESARVIGSRSLPGALAAASRRRLIHRPQTRISAATADRAQRPPRKCSRDITRPNPDGPAVLADAPAPPRLVTGGGTDAVRTRGRARRPRLRPRSPTLACAARKPHPAARVVVLSSTRQPHTNASLAGRPHLHAHIFVCVFVHTHQGTVACRGDSVADC
jgi:hypothetical protein